MSGSTCASPHGGAGEDRGVHDTHGCSFLSLLFLLSALEKASLNAVMLSFTLRRGLGRAGPAIASRCFSTTPSMRAAEVKKLGVIGAGQMVSFLRATGWTFNSLL